MIMGSMVRTPWPTSGFLAMMVTVPSAATRMNAFGLMGRLRASTALRLSFGFHVEAEGDAAARERADSQK